MIDYAKIRQATGANKRQVDSIATKLNTTDSDRIITELKGNPTSTKKSKLEERGKNSGANLSQVIDAAADKLAGQIKRQVSVRAVTKVLEDFENGDFGDLGELLDEGFGGLCSTLDVQYAALIEGGEDEEDPKALPPSSETFSESSFRPSSEPSSNGRGRNEILSIA